MRTKLVLANFEGGGGSLLYDGLSNVQNTVNGIGIWDPMSIWGVGGRWGLGLGIPYQVSAIDRNKCVELIDYNVF
jgi:hypothetical protein